MYFNTCDCKISLSMSHIIFDAYIPIICDCSSSSNDFNSLFSDNLSIYICNNFLICFNIGLIICFTKHVPPSSRNHALSVLFIICLTINVSFLIFEVQNCCSSGSSFL